MRYENSKLPPGRCFWAFFSAPRESLRKLISSHSSRVRRKYLFDLLCWKQWGVGKGKTLLSIWFGGVLVKSYNLKDFEQSGMILIRHFIFKKRT